MSTDVEMQKYHLMKVDDILLNINGTNHNNSISFNDPQRAFNQFSLWLDKYMLFLPMFVMSRPNGTKRSQLFTMFIIIIMILINIILIIPWIHQTTIYLFIYIIQSFSRFIGIYYFYKQFDYPWHNIPSKWNFNQNIYKKYNKNKTLKIILITFIVIDILWIFGVSRDENYWNQVDLYLNDYYYLRWIYWIIDTLFVDFPCIFTLFIHCILSMKYEYYLLELRNNIIENKDNLETIYLKYKCLYHSFINEYPLTLNYSIQLYVFNMVLSLWIDTNNIKYWGNSINSALWRISDYFWYLLVLIIFVTSSSNVCKQYNELYKQIWRYSQQNMMNILKSESEKETFVLYAIYYVANFKVALYIGNYQVTICNAIKLVLLFVIAKYIAYLK